MAERTISRATALPAINLGLAIAIVLAIWTVAGDLREQKILVSDTASRQGKYVGQSGLYTQQIRDLREAHASLCEKLAAQHGEVMC